MINKKNFSILLFVIASLVATNLVIAQDSPTPTPSVAPVISLPPSPRKPNASEAVGHVLSLTDAQKVQLRVYFDSVQARLDAIEDQAHQAQDSILKQLLAQIRPLLTPRQQAKADAIQLVPAAAMPPVALN